jgi:hypothetical protein
MAMTVKQQLHAVVDDLDEESATEVLAFALRSARRDRDKEHGGPSASEPGIDVDRENLWQVARPMTDDDPFWSNPGLLDDDGPSDMSSDKHRYLARIYANLHDE